MRTPFDGAMQDLETLMATLGTRIFTWMRGETVGRDEFGNRYYQEKGVKDGRWRRRWVLYKGRPEASKVPPDWHAWLHRTTEEPPSRAPLPEQAWEKEHLPNLTGTKARYLPPGHILKGGKRAPATGDYEAWRPE